MSTIFLLFWIDLDVFFKCCHLKLDKEAIFDGCRSENGGEFWILRDFKEPGFCGTYLSLVWKLFNRSYVYVCVFITDSLTTSHLAFSTIFPLFVNRFELSLRFCYREFDKEAIRYGLRTERPTRIAIRYGLRTEKLILIEKRLKKTCKS